MGAWERDEACCRLPEPRHFLQCEAARLASRALASDALAGYHPLHEHTPADALPDDARRHCRARMEVGP